MKSKEKTILIIMVASLFFELSFLPTQICEYNQNTKQQVCTVSDTTSKIVWHTLKFLDDNSSAFTAIATIVIAYFTYTLWEATHGLRKLAIKQGEDTLESLKIARDSVNALIEQNIHLQSFVSAAERQAGAAEQSSAALMEQAQHIQSYVFATERQAAATEQANAIAEQARLDAEWAAQWKMLSDKS